MGSVNRRMTLSEQIAEILVVRAQAAGAAGAGNHNSPGLTVKKSIACGSMMMLAINPAPVGAVGLGEIHLQSRLGQPLEATVPLRLGEGESLPRNCVKPAPANNTLGAPPNMRVISPERNGPGTYNIRISTANPLHEPMYELSLMIKCPGTPLLVRQYVLMLDLPGMPGTTAAPAPVASVANTNSQPPLVSAPRTVTSGNGQQQAGVSRALPPRADGIRAGSQYRVANGDTLSTIARRIEGRLADTTWLVADQIFADNPGAFIRNDPNMIKLGSLITVPATSVLTTMEPHARRSGQPPAISRQPAPVAKSAPEHQTPVRPAPAPVTVSRNEVVAARAARNTPTAQTTARWPTPGSAEADAISKSMEVAPTVEPVIAATTTDTASDPATSYPFADEAPAQPVANNKVATAAPTETVTESQEPEQSSSLLSILFGLLLGAALSLLIFRSRLLVALGVRRQTRPAAAVTRRPHPAANQTSGFDPSLAAAAFDATSGGADKVPYLPIGGPVEDTYIVETGVAEPTVKENVEDLRARNVDSDTAEQPPSIAPIDDEEQSAELAKLFENDFATGGAPAGAGSPTINEPTVEMPQSSDVALDATADLPRHADSEFFDPTAEMPAGALDDIFDPTGGVDGEPLADVDPTLMQAFSDDLENFDPDEMFATASHGIDDLTVEAGAISPDDTINDPLIEDPTVESELDHLPSGNDEDENLSETLHEALALLERDFEEEFTASQILERSALEKSLKADLEQEEIERTADDVRRKTR